MLYNAVNPRFNSTLENAKALRTKLRRLGVQVKSLVATPMSEGGTIARPVDEEDLADLGIEPWQPLNVSLIVSVGGPDAETNVAMTQRQFTLYGLFGGLMNLLPGWGCKQPMAFITSQPGVGTAIERALERLVNIGESEVANAGPATKDSYTFGPDVVRAR